MSDPGIPVRKKVPAAKVDYLFDSTDHDLFDAAPAGLWDVIKLYIHECNVTTTEAIDASVAKLREENLEHKTRYVIEVTETYNMMMTAILSSSESISKKLYHEIPGEYDDARTPRTIENWKRCNPNKTTVVHTIFETLRANGWTPEIKGISSDVLIDEDAMWSGGNKLVIVCDFTE